MINFLDTLSVHTLSLIQLTVVNDFKTFPLDWGTWVARYCSKEAHFSSSSPATTIIAQIPTSDATAPLWSTCRETER